MHMAKSLKDKKIISFFYIHKTQKNSKICFSMYFGFNNKFIKVMRTKPIF
jgi:hypothetical protein